MQQEEGIIVLLAIALLGICYFAPISSSASEMFANIVPMRSPDGKLLKNPQGSYISKNTFNPNPQNSLNTFPYMEQSSTSSNGVINLIKSDGVILGGYVPQILRPPDNVTAQLDGDKCNFPCYSDIKHQKWCSEDVAINYYGMRPLISPDKYNNLLKAMFEKMIDSNCPRAQNVADTEFTAVFCTETKESLMSWLMQKVALVVSQMPQMQRNGPWKSERFYETDTKMYQFVNSAGNVHFKIVFNLYNPLRSVATLVVAVVYVVDGKPLLQNMDFVNEGVMGDYMKPMNGWGSINGQNIRLRPKNNGGDIEQFEPLGVPSTPEGRKMWEEEYKKDPNEFDWNYKNTLEVQKFNKYGFYSIGDNVEIEGGVPESLKNKLKYCKEENLMSCSTPGFTGILAVSAKALNEDIINVDDAFAKLDGEVKNVYVNPSIVYNVQKLKPIAGIST